jgi:uncharacterized membrane protein YGL010W
MRNICLHLKCWASVVLPVVQLSKAMVSGVMGSKIEMFHSEIIKIVMSLEYYRLLLVFNLYFFMVFATENALSVSKFINSHRCI